MLALSVIYCRFIFSKQQVEYVDRSGQHRLALAEAPNEALPSNCRPTFGAAWLTKDKFKVAVEFEAFSVEIYNLRLISIGLIYFVVSILIVHFSP